MARKKQEIQLQKDISSEDQWENTVLSHNGLMVVDVYQTWCGPCKAVPAMFRRIKNEAMDELLAFAVASCETIESLVAYRGHCQPTFLFISNGVLVSVIRGCDGPLLIKTISDELLAEHRCQEEGNDRMMFVDIGLEAEEEQPEDIKPPPPKKQSTVVIIKPDAVQEGKVDEIVEKIRSEGIDIIHEEERTLTPDEAKDFYFEHSEEPYYDDLISFMSSGPSYLLVCTKGKTGNDVINKIRSLIGPMDVDEARSVAPDSLRAQYGHGGTENAVHSSDSTDKAARELAFFFPDFSLPDAEEEEPLQRTLAIIRPDALLQYRDKIIDNIQDAGFQIAFQKEIQLTVEQAQHFYKEHEQEDYFQTLVDNMTSGPVLALCLAREDAINRWRDMLGPKVNAEEEAPMCLRAQFSVDASLVNPLHGSESPDKAESELGYFFPVQKTLAVIKPDAQDVRDEIITKIEEAGFMIAAQKETVLTKEIASQFYKEHEDKDFFGNLTDFMSSGTTLFMVLQREDAMTAWREMIGPTDPATARELAPDSLRALFGSDILHNAIHGSSNDEQASLKIQTVFGDDEGEEQEPMIEEEAPEQEVAAPADEMPVPVTEGEAADEGADGEAAAEGADGEAAAEGADGEAAAEGADGEAAAEGADGEAAAEGADGEAAAEGADGEAAAGADGEAEVEGVDVEAAAEGVEGEAAVEGEGGDTEPAASDDPVQSEANEEAAPAEEVPEGVGEETTEVTGETETEEGGQSEVPTEPSTAPESESQPTTTDGPETPSVQP